MYMAIQVRNSYVDATEEQAIKVAKQLQADNGGKWFVVKLVAVVSPGVQEVRPPTPFPEGATTIMAGYL